MTSPRWRDGAVNEPVEPDRRAATGLEAADPALLADGWERRFVIEGRRASEFAEVYRQAGLEVRLEPLTPSRLPEGCTDCQLVLLLEFRTVYTRRRSPDRHAG